MSNIACAGHVGNDVQRKLGVRIYVIDGRGQNAILHRKKGDDSFDGPSIIFNVWAASNGKVNRFLLQEARKIAVGKDTIYFKRYYKDGSTRRIRLRVNDFVAKHREQKAASAD